MIEYFLRRPVFAAVASLIIVLAGLVAIPALPIAQYPNIAPPTVVVSTQYLGANARAVESSVTTPLEEAINGVPGLRYISSSSGNDGSSTITATFDLSKNVDTAQSDVQDAVLTVNGRLPQEVRESGVVVKKTSTSILLGLGMVTRNPQFNYFWLSNYTENNIVNALKRLPGVGDVRIFGQRRWAMRIWLDPRKLAFEGLTATDVIGALQRQNVQVAAGAIGGSPTNGRQPYEMQLSASGRLTSADDFGRVILRALPGGGAVYLSDVARIELGAEDYSTFTHWNDDIAVGMGIFLAPNANALQTARLVEDEMKRLSADFPPGVSYVIPWNSTMFVAESIREVSTTLVIAIALVVLVIFLFLQNVRMTVIPLLTIPVSLIGTFAILKALNFSINTLTLFGLTLATGLVVDDAIVVIENIARYVHQHRSSVLEATRAAMREISGAVVATSLVLLAVFIPVAFLPGTTGMLYKQFAITISASIAISLFVALTLTPALTAMLIGRGSQEIPPFLVPVNRAIEAIQRAYRQLLPVLLRYRFGILAGFAASLVLTLLVFKTTPTGFIPDEDQGYLIVSMQMPEGTSIDQERQFAASIAAAARKAAPEVIGTFLVDGYNFFGAAPNHSFMFLPLKPWSERPGAAHTAQAIAARLQPMLFGFPQGQAFVFNPPAVQGVGNFGGFQFEALDTRDVGIPALLGASYGVIMKANTDPRLHAVFSTFRADSPQLGLQIDRRKVAALNVPFDSVFTSMQTYFGSMYVNDFTYQDRAYRVFVEADPKFRSSQDALASAYVRSNDGGLVPLSELMQPSPEKVPPTITHYNLFRSVEIDGQPAPGHGSGEAISAMESLARSTFPPGVQFAWTGLSLEQIEGGSAAALIFLLGIAFVFLVLAAQYENFWDPLIILLAVPLAVLGALLTLRMRGLTSDVFAQIGYVMLIGLASKNAILIVEFANQLRRHGLGAAAAVRRAAQARLRPILMTSFAFILGAMPLVFASGAGSAARHSLGTGLVGGMLLSTILNLGIVPVLYVLVAALRERVTKRPLHLEELTPRDVSA